MVVSSGRALHESDLDDVGAREFAAMTYYPCPKTSIKLFNSSWLDAADQGDNFLVRHPRGI